MLAYWRGHITATGATTVSEKQARVFPGKPLVASRLHLDTFSGHCTQQNLNEWYVEPA